MRISDWSSDVCSSDLNIVECHGKASQLGVVIDDLDKERPVVFENMAPVHVRRAAEPQPRLQNRDASQARIPCPGCNNFKYPAITQIGAFVSVDSQQLDCFSHDILLHAGSGAFGSTCSSRLDR